MDDIRKAESERMQLLTQLQMLTDSKGKEDLQQKIKQLEFDQETAIMNLLEKTDRDYDALVQENFDLMINSSIALEVVRSHQKEAKGHGLVLNAQTDDAGIFHGRATFTSFSILPYYPDSYVGLINYLGEADLYVNHKKYTWLTRRVPRKWTGSINEKGGISLEAKDDFFEDTSGVYISHFRADLFTGDGMKRTRFIANRESIRKRILEYRDGLMR